MYPKNAASPEPIAIGAVVQISDGAVQTSGCTVRIKPIGVAEANGVGTTAYSTDGIVLYTPTQAETNYTSFVLIAKKTACIPVSITVVTSASATAGYAGTDQSKIANPTSTVALTGTTIATTQKVDVETIKTQALTAAAGITFGVYVGGTAAAAVASTALSTATWTGTLATNLTTLASHDPGTTIGTSTLTQAQITGGAYALNSSSFSFNAGMDFTTTQKAATIARVTLVDTLTTYTSNTPQTGDSFARLGAPAGASVSADIAAEATRSQAIKDRVSYCLTVLVGACADAGTSAETYTFAIGGETFTADYTGLDATGNRTTTTLSKV